MAVGEYWWSAFYIIKDKKVKFHRCAMCHSKHIKLIKHYTNGMWGLRCNSCGAKSKPHIFKFRALKEWRS